MDLILKKLAGIANRNAQFRTVVALVLDGQTYTFEGICKGKIAMKKSGTGGFGYDPVFVPEGYTTTFAEMDAEIKNSISHRGKAVKNLIQFLKEQH